MAGLDSDDIVANWDLHLIAVVFSIMVLACFCSLVGLSAYVRKTRKQHGLQTHRWEAVPPWWPTYVKDLIAMVTLLLVLVPVIVILCSVVFGIVLAAAEGWLAIQGIEYIAGNLAGLSSPLTGVSPTTAFGDFIDIIVSLWCLLLASAFMGVAGSLRSVSWISDTMPSTFVGFLRYIFLWIPACLLLVGAFCGGILAAKENWSWFTGFLFMLSSMCGLQTSLVSVSPTDPAGIFVEFLGLAVELTLGGAIIGVIGAHPYVASFITFLEGKPAEDWSSEIERVQSEAAMVAKEAPFDAVVAASPPPKDAAEVSLSEDIPEISIDQNNTSAPQDQSLSDQDKLQQTLALLEAERREKAVLRDEVSRLKAELLALKRVDGGEAASPDHPHAVPPS